MSNVPAQWQSHPHHLTAESPWPILTSGAILAILSSAALWFNDLEYSGILLVLGIISTTIAIALWFADVTTEGVYLGKHTRIVQHCLSIGVSLFIVTEAFFFISVFWAYFHSSLSPTVELACTWPPIAISSISPLAVPLLNTLLLVSSGATITYAHHAILNGRRAGAIYGTLLTVVLALIFIGLQGFEYTVSSFTIADGAFGSCFYLSTGFHGLHVIVGIVFITVGLYRTVKYHYTRSHHVGFESAIIYFHFVDVVWLFLFIVIYCWDGSFTLSHSN